MNMIQKYIQFTKEAYAPLFHLVYTLLLYAALAGTFAFFNTKQWTIGLKDVLAVASMFLVFLYLRVVDEIKDYEYDKAQNPDRPLARGFVAHKDLYIYSGLLFLVTVAMNLFVSIPCLVIVAADMVYGMLLVFVEKKSKMIENNMLLNLLVTYPVNVALSVYALFVYYDKIQMPTTLAVLVVVVFALAFLTWEFGRKISWPVHAHSGKRYYSGDIGTVPAVLLYIVFALSAASLIILLVKPWQSMPGYFAIALPVLFPVAGVIYFVKAKNRQNVKKETILQPFAAVYLLLFFVILIALAVVYNRIVI